MPAARVTGFSQPSIDYTLNLLGVRVWEDACVLIAKSGWEWRPLGAVRRLPVLIPRNPSQLDADELCMTALQYQREHPDADLADLLCQRKSFTEALGALVCQITPIAAK
jgi:hypothetical protein